MERLVINLGQAPNDGQGDPVRNGGEKINQNFEELFSRIGNLSTPYGGSESQLLAQAIRFFAVTALDPTDLLYIEEMLVAQPVGINFHYLLKIFNATSVDSDPQEDTPWLIWEYTGPILTHPTRITLAEDDGSGVNGVMIVDFSVFQSEELSYQPSGYMGGMLTNFCNLSRWYPFKSKSQLITESTTHIDGSDRIYILKPPSSSINVALEIIELIKDSMTFKNVSIFNVNIGVAHTWEGAPVLDMFDFGGGMIVLEPGKSVQIYPVDGLGDDPPFLTVIGEYSLPE